MHRAVPVPSKILARKYNERNYDAHQQRLREMKPTFQIDKPKEFRYLAEKPKRQQMLEGKCLLSCALFCIVGQKSVTRRSSAKTGFYSRK